MQYMTWNCIQYIECTEFSYIYLIFSCFCFWLYIVYIIFIDSVFPLGLRNKWSDKKLRKKVKKTYRKMRLRVFYGEPKIILDANLIEGEAYISLARKNKDDW